MTTDRPRRCGAAIRILRMLVPNSCPSPGRDDARHRVAGVDEVGRGCLAGPVYAAAVVLPADAVIEGLRDSKQLSAAQRDRVAARIRVVALSWAISRAEVEEIDRLNILQASLLAMRRAVAALHLRPHECRIDGNQDPALPDLPVRLIVGGDAIEPSIMAASVLAKVVRDAEMARLDAVYPGYGLARHKGYGTAQHLQALRQRGPSPVHRMSFSPCRTAAEECASRPAAAA